MLAPLLVTSLALAGTSNLVASAPAFFPVKETLVTNVSDDLPPVEVIDRRFYQCTALNNTSGQVTQLTPRAEKIRYWACGDDPNYGDGDPNGGDDQPPTAEEVTFTKTKLYAPAGKLFANNKTFLPGWSMTYKPIWAQGDPAQTWVYQVAAIGYDPEASDRPTFQGDFRGDCRESMDQMLKKCTTMEDNYHSGGVWFPDRAAYIYTPEYPRNQSTGQSLWSPPAWTPPREEESS